MSHFSVLVTGDHVAALQPFHEYECTGTNDQYVLDVDRTAEARERYAESTETRMREIATGALFDRFDEKGNWVPRFSQPDTDRLFGLPGLKALIPEGFEQVEVPTPTVESFAEWASGYYGATIFRCNPDQARTLRVQLHDLASSRQRAGIDVKSQEYAYGYTAVDEAGEVIVVCDRTNPNKKWDWYEVGGRWPGKLLLKSGRATDRGTAGEIDWEKMIERERMKAAQTYDEVKQIIAGRPYTPWGSIMARVEAKEISWEQARAEHNDQPVWLDLQKDERFRWDGAEIAAGVIAMSRGSYLERMSLLNASTWALLHEGVWSERGSMGWWGTSDATDASMDAHIAHFWDTVRSLPANTSLTVVDCHI